MSGVGRVPFEVIPAGWDGVQLEDLAFRPMLLEVPYLFDSGRAPAAELDKCARRAWWSVFHMLGPRGLEPEDFEVFEYSESQGRGRPVGPGGFTDEASILARA